MNKVVSLWVRVSEEGRIVDTAKQKEWLKTPVAYPKEKILHDIELTGVIENAQI